MEEGCEGRHHRGHCCAGLVRKRKKIPLDSLPITPCPVQFISHLLDTTTYISTTYASFFLIPQNIIRIMNYPPFPLIYLYLQLPCYLDKRRKFSLDIFNHFHVSQ